MMRAKVGGRVIGGGIAIRLDSGATWPHPERAAEMSWTLRYGDPSTINPLAMAEVCFAYAHLITTPSAAQHLPPIRRVLAEAPSEGDET